MDTCSKNPENSIQFPLRKAKVSFVIRIVYRVVYKCNNSSWRIEEESLCLPFVTFENITKLQFDYSNCAGISDSERLSIPRVIEESWVEFVLRFFLSISRSQSIKRNVVSRFLFFLFFRRRFFRWIRYAIFFLNLCSQFYVYFGRLWIWVGDATFSVQWYKWIGRATASVIRGYSIDCLPCRE